jgi:hypothetical protein
MYLAPYTTMCVVPAGASSEEVKITFTLEQAMKAQRGSRGIAILFL